MTDAVKDSDGSPKWRVAPSPHGIYWREGMKLGYQDCGSWTLMRNTDPERRAAAWLYAQFVTSKTVSLKKSIVGTTFIRESDLQTDYLTENADQFAGLIEFYRSSARLLYTPTGSNVPNYAAQTPLWKAHIAPAVHGNLTAQEALDNLATAQDDLMVQLAATGDMLRCIPKLNPEREPEFWLEAFPGAPYPKLADEEGVPSTMSYDELIKAWTAVPDEPSIDDGTSDALTMTFSLMLLLLSSWCVFGWQCS